MRHLVARALIVVMLSAALLAPRRAAAQSFQYVTMGPSSIVAQNTTAAVNLIDPNAFAGATALYYNPLVYGHTLLWHADLIMSTALIAPTLTVRLKLGTTTLATLVFSSLGGGATDAPISSDVYTACTSWGATGTWMVGGGASYATGLQTRNFVGVNSMTPVTYDFTQTPGGDFHVDAQWSAASTSNKVQSNMILISYY